MKVQRADIDKRIAKVEFINPGPSNPSTTTLAIVRLDNGFEVIGHSAAVDPTSFDLKTGERLAFDDAISQLYGYFAFLLLEAKHQDKQDKTFGGALRALKAGKTVARKGKVGVSELHKVGNTIVHSFLGGSAHIQSFHKDDVLAEDFVVVGE